jgi:hypothetical protein
MGAYGRRGFATRMKATTSGGSPGGGKEFFEFKATRINGEKINRLGDIVGNKKAILVVNVASE